ncbi:hypothetical protein PsorP6_011370 [Peronosclerospora sorghi]|uniref:Uncharacterized protein n=1 Tax=Peronosclerospora sorghi TaxID=230839 RepID=A0ACC0WMA4_9STRA|nr:hypothetical protein PsorP6_011370 [Peronosclerospora sorghi]
MLSPMVLPAPVDPDDHFPTAIDAMMRIAVGGQTRLATKKIFGTMTAAASAACCPTVLLRITPSSSVVFSIFSSKSSSVKMKSSGASVQPCRMPYVTPSQLDSTGFAPPLTRGEEMINVPSQCKKSVPAEVGKLVKERKVFFLSMPMILSNEKVGLDIQKRPWVMGLSPPTCSSLSFDPAHCLPFGRTQERPSLYS